MRHALRMPSACYRHGVSAIQIKDVPDDVHDALRVRASERGTTIGAYLLELIRLDLQRNRTGLWFDELRRRPAVVDDAPRIDPAALVVDARTERDAAVATAADRAPQGRVVLVDRREPPIR